MSRSRRRARTRTAPDHLPRWPVAAGASALLLAVVVGAYTGGQFFVETRSQVEEMTVTSGILVEPSGAPESEPSEDPEPEEEAHPAGLDPAITYALLNVNGERALDVAGGSTDNGADVHLWDRHDEENQQWRFVPVEDDFYEIVGVGSDKLLEFPAEPDPEADPESAHAASLLSRTGEHNQHWTLVEVGDGVVRLVNRASGQALEGQGGADENGTLAYPAEDGGHPHQQWRLAPLG
ncbi:RICIN domain-containing protein [Nocardiopsis sp. JB363]|uniref:RICIN domain-containing protein n=1 Tax=Nocardiopsis sp. JB363 TaxID=1434837 RepID=UPI00097A12CC|nr:RICIN domain-containing protein [Nocardiopsis sp. JB363]SIO87164.1 arabinofuranosidase [Nocardiopsis sp. JB363]